MKSKKDRYSRLKKIPFIGKKLSKSLIFLSECIIPAYFKRRIPILIYQMGKVGSTSIVKSLKKNKSIFVLREHYLLPENINLNERVLSSRRKWLYKRIRKKKSLLIITLFRDPVSRGLSDFFRTIEHKNQLVQPWFQTKIHSLIKERNNVSFTSIEDAIDIYIKYYNQDATLNWFDIEFEKTTGIDVYKHPFPKKEGYLKLEDGKVQILLLKIEIPDGEKEKIVAEFTDITDFKLQRYHLTEDKEIGSTYSEIKKTMKLPKQFLNEILQSKYTTHFYSTQEIEEIYNKWVLN